MIAIERTAYPRFKLPPSARQLSELYTPTPDELAFARSITRGASALLSLLVLLKTFQCLGYFKRLNEIPENIVNHIRAFAELSSTIRPQVEPRTFYKYHKVIRSLLKIASFATQAQAVAKDAITNAAPGYDQFKHPFIINSSKYQRAFGENAATPYREGIRQTINWYRSSTTIVDPGRDGILSYAWHWIVKRARPRN